MEYKTPRDARVLMSTRGLIFYGRIIVGFSWVCCHSVHMDDEIYGDCVYSCKKEEVHTILNNKNVWV